MKGQGHVAKIPTEKMHKRLSKLKQEKKISLGEYLNAIEVLDDLIPVLDDPDFWHMHWKIFK